MAVGVSPLATLFFCLFVVVFSLGHVADRRRTENKAKHARALFNFATLFLDIVDGICARARALNVSRVFRPLRADILSMGARSLLRSRIFELEFLCSRERK